MRLKNEREGEKINNPRIIKSTLVMDTSVELSIVKNVISGVLQLSEEEE